MPKRLRPECSENEKHVTEKWNLKQTVHFLRLYKYHRCLWDLKDPDYRNRKLRKAALLDLTATLNEGITYNQLLRKIHTLRGTYQYEKLRIKRRLRRGLGASTKLKWFELADALFRKVPDGEKLRKSTEAKASDGSYDSEYSDLVDNVVFPVGAQIFTSFERKDLNNLDSSSKDDDKFRVVTETLNTESNDMVNHNLEGTVESDGESCSSLPTNDINRNASEDCLDLRCSQNENVLNSSLDQDNNLKLSQRRWTCIESILFVQLLREKPILWKNNAPQQFQNDLKYQEALDQIANAMKIPNRRIIRRLRTFKLSYAKEKERMNKSPNHKSTLVWFKLADTFMNDVTPLLKPPDFVCLNVLPSETSCDSLQEQQLGNEKVDRNDEEEINPPRSIIPSSLSGSTQLEISPVVFCDKQSDNKDTQMKCELTLNSSPLLHDSIMNIESEIISSPSAAPPTKIIRNGLEDDLVEGKWSLKHSVQFLRLYGSHRCLWDCKDPHYRSRVLRDAAMTDIAAAMGSGLNATHVAKKIKNFRKLYMQHRRRLLEAYKKSEKVETELRWFPLADCFLRSHTGRRSIRQNEREIPQFDHEYVSTKLNLIDPTILNDITGKGTQNSIDIGDDGENELED